MKRRINSNYFIILPPENFPRRQIETLVYVIQNFGLTGTLTPQMSSQNTQAQRLVQKSTYIQKLSPMQLPRHCD